MLLAAMNHVKHASDIVLWLVLSMVVGVGSGCEGAKKPQPKPPLYDRDYFTKPDEKLERINQDPRQINSGEEIQQLIDEVNRIQEDYEEFVHATSIALIQCHYSLSAIMDAAAAHYLNRFSDSPWLDEVVGGVYDAYVSALDPHGIYFDAGDRYHLSKHSSQMMSYLENKDCSFIDETYELYAKKARLFHNRLQVALNTADNLDQLRNQWIYSPIYLNYFDQWIAPEFYLRTDMSFAQTAELVRARWHMRNQKLRESTDHMYSWTRYEIFLDSVLSSFDSSSGYLSEDEWVSNSHDLGMYVSPGYGHVEITALHDEGAARSAGLKLKDRIVAVICHDSRSHCEGHSQVRLSDVTAKELITYLNLKNHDRLEFEIHRPTAPYKFEKKRVVLKDLKASYAPKVTAFVSTDLNSSDDSSKVGVLKVPYFYHYHDQPDSEGSSQTHSVYEDIKAQIHAFNHKQVDGILLDLRGNTGGPLFVASQVLSLFLNEPHGFQYVMGPADHSGYQVSLDDETYPQQTHLPLVVMVDRWTASLAELVAQTLQVHKRAVVIGDSATFGKGTIQGKYIGRQVRPDEDDGEDLGQFTITTGQFFSVNGYSPQGVGVWSDIVIPSLTESLVADYSSQPHPISSHIRVDPIDDYQPSPDDGFSERIIAARSLSRSRIEASQRFTVIHKVAHQIQQIQQTSDDQQMVEMRQGRWSPLEQLFVKQRIYGYSDQRLLHSIVELYDELSEDLGLEEAILITQDLISLERDEDL